MSWMRSGTLLSQFLRVLLLTSNFSLGMNKHCRSYRTEANLERKQHISCIKSKTDVLNISVDPSSN